MSQALEDTDQPPRESSKKNRDVVAWIALAFSVPALAISLWDVADRVIQAFDEQDRKEGVAVALNNDNSPELARVAAEASPGSPAQAFLAAVSDAAATREGAVLLPALSIDTSCAALSASCDSTSDFSFDDRGLVEAFQVAGVPVANLLVKPSTVGVEEGVTASILSGFIAPDKDSATVTVRVVNASDEIFELDGARFSSSDVGIGVINLDDESSVRGAICDGTTSVASRSVGTMVCRTERASIGLLDLQFVHEGTSRTVLLAIP